METSAIGGTPWIYKAAQTQQTMTTTLMKQAAQQQNQMAGLLAEMTASIPQPVDSDYNFTIYA